MKTPDQEQIERSPRQLLLQALDKRWENYCAELNSCRSEFTEDAVHDLRVATRRMLALIQLLNSISPQPRLKKMTRGFKDQLDEFDNLRDTQVILNEISQIVHELPQLEEFEQHLRSHEEEMLKDLNTKLRQRDTSKMAGWFHKTQEDVGVWGDDHLESLLLDAVDDAFLTVMHRLRWVDLARSATIHRVRTAFKAFRYMVEIVHPLVREFPPELLKQLNGYQTLMGDIQDAEVFAQTLTNFTKGASFLDFDTVHNYYERRRSQAISDFADAKDQLYSFWRLASDQPFPWE